MKPCWLGLPCRYVVIHVIMCVCSYLSPEPFSCETRFAAAPAFRSKSKNFCFPLWSSSKLLLMFRLWFDSRMMVSVAVLPPKKVAPAPAMHSLAPLCGQRRRLCSFAVNRFRSWLWVPGQPQSLIPSPSGMRGGRSRIAPSSSASFCQLWVLVVLSPRPCVFWGRKHQSFPEIVLQTV